MSVFLSHNNILSHLGADSLSVFENILQGKTGLDVIESKELLPEKFCASLLSEEKINKAFSDFSNPSEYTKLEKMMILSLKQVIEGSGIELNKDVGFIISTTKGNIDVLDSNAEFSKERAYLHNLGNVIQEYFNFKNEAIVLSNACVSGILAISVAKRLILQKKFKYVFIVGGDLVTQFILSGFNSFQALSGEACKPYDKNRIGINLGEVAAAVLVTPSKENLAEEAVEILGDATQNDANHISGPSRTGEGLYRSVKRALKESKIQPKEIDYISAHGTATVFNDEMEAIAFNRLGMEEIPLNSLKGYFGHTLGASGLIETIIGMHALNRNILIESKGYTEHGVSKPLNVIRKNSHTQLTTFLKTASGFGGCNTAVVFRKNTN